jgi:septal ring factor EnvC (AmiA/AmiB activator)
MTPRIAFVALVALAALSPAARGQSDTQPIPAQQALLRNYEEQIANLKLIIADKDQKIAALDQQLALTRQNRDLLEQIVSQSQQIADVQKQSIADRDAVIQQLAKSAHDSTLTRLVESIPSIASIIAIAFKK